jgi:hypothetical protein
MKNNNLIEIENVPPSLEIGIVSSYLNQVKITTPVAANDVSSYFPEDNKSLGEMSIGSSYFGESEIKSYITNDENEINPADNDAEINTAGFKLFHKNKNIIPFPSVGFENRKNDICYSVVHQEWHGYIEQISDDGNFTAVLKDISEDEADIRAEFSIDEINEGDRDLIKEGALIRWVIGKERRMHGQVKNYDTIILPRFPKYLRDDLNKESAVVEEFNRWLNETE